MTHWFGLGKRKEITPSVEQSKVAALEQDLNAKMRRRAQLAGEIETLTQQLQDIAKASLNAANYCEDVYEDQYNLTLVEIDAKKNEFISLGNDLQVLRDQMLVLNTPISDDLQIDLEEIERTADAIEMKVERIKEVSAATRKVAERTRHAYQQLAKNAATHADSEFAMAQLEMLARDRAAAQNAAEPPVKDSPFKRAQAQARAEAAAANAAPVQPAAPSVKTSFPTAHSIGEDVESILREADRASKGNSVAAHPVMNDVESLLKEADRGGMKLNLGVRPMSVKMADSYILNMNNCDNAGKGA